MNFNSFKQTYFLPLFLLLISILYNSCLQKPDLKKISFKNVIGIHYTEVKRRINTGRSFDSRGYEVNPEWRMFIMPNDSASVFSPDSNRFLTFGITLDHDSLFNVASTWFRAKKITKDSLFFQVMRVEGHTVYLLHSNLFMTLYSDAYIKRKHLDVPTLQRPDRADTLFVRQRSMLADKFPDTLFAARVPVVLKSRSPLVKVKKEETSDAKINHYSNPDSYLDPTYDITINKAYQDFFHSFKVRVDNKGEMQLVKNLTFSDDSELDTKIIKGIIDGYLKLYIEAIPGNTLGFTHATVITLNVFGNKK